jgi:hypothetical protein
MKKKLIVTIFVQRGQMMVNNSLLLISERISSGDLGLKKKRLSNMSL